MGQASAKNHDFHILEPSPWPLIGSISSFVLALGGLLYFAFAKEQELEFSLFGLLEPANFVPSVSISWLLVGLGLIGVFYTMFAWWTDVVKEAEGGFHTEVVQIHHRYGMILFIASEVMFFVAWFWAYFDAAFYPDIAIQVSRVEHLGASWPPAGLETLDPWHLPLMNTMVLLLSGTTVTWAHHALIENNRSHLKWGLFYTIALGVFFTGLQAYEYGHASFGLSGSIYNSTFYLATGFHGFHVLVGTAVLIVCFFRALAGHFTPKQHVGFESAAWYWHFVDVVWLFLFVFVYVMPEIAPVFPVE